MKSERKRGGKSAQRDALPKIFHYTFGGVGVLLLTIAALIFYFDQKAVNQYTKVEGKVTRNQFVNGAARPIIVYTWQGEDKTFVGNTYSSPPAFERGEQVELFVNPNDSSEVIVNSFSERFLAITILSGIGVFFLGFIFLFNYLSKKL